MIQVCFFGKNMFVSYSSIGTYLIFVISVMLEELIVIANIQYFIRTYKIRAF